MSVEQIELNQVTNQVIEKNVKNNVREEIELEVEYVESMGEDIDGSGDGFVTVVVKDLAVNVEGVDVDAGVEGQGEKVEKTLLSKEKVSDALVQDIVKEESNVRDSVDEVAVNDEKDDTVIAEEVEITEEEVVEEVEAVEEARDVDKVTEVAEAKEVTEEVVAEAVEVTEEVVKDDAPEKATETAEVLEVATEEEAVVPEEDTEPAKEVIEDTEPVTAQEVSEATPVETLELKSKFTITKPLSRSTTGPALAASAITSSVGRTNPIHDEILFALHSIHQNSPTMTCFDVSNYPLSQNQATALVHALESNTFVTSLKLRNSGVTNATAIQLAQVLKSNTTITFIDLEHNNIGPQGIREFAYTLSSNSTITELKLNYQKTKTGQEAEHALADSLQRNKTVVKLGLAIVNPACRDRIDRAVTRNKEIARKARLLVK